MIIGNVEGIRSAHYCTTEMNSCYQFLDEIYSTPVNITADRFYFNPNYNIRVNNTGGYYNEIEIIRFWEHREAEFNISGNNTLNVDVGVFIDGEYSILYDNVVFYTTSPNNGAITFTKTTDTNEHNYKIENEPRPIIPEWGGLQCYDNVILHCQEGNVFKCVVCPFYNIIGTWFFMVLAVLVAVAGYVIGQNVALAGFLMALVGGVYMFALPLYGQFWGAIAILLGMVAVIYSMFAGEK